MFFSETRAILKEAEIKEKDTSVSDNLMAKSKKYEKMANAVRKTEEAEKDIKKEDAEEAEFFNSNDGSEVYSSKEISIDDIIVEITEEENCKINESFPVFISLVNDKPVINESKDIDEVYISFSSLLESNYDGRDLYTIVLFLNEDQSNILREYDGRFNRILIDKVNSGMNTNKAISQFVDLILHENSENIANKKAYTVYKGATNNYSDRETDNILSEMTTNVKYLNESMNFYSNEFNIGEWLKYYSKL